MARTFHQLSLLFGATLSLAAAVPPSAAFSAIPAQVTNPIARIARIIDPQLVKVEDRVTWLEHHASSYSQHCEYPLKTGLGYRGGRSKPGDPDPSVTLDLGREVPIEAIYLVPAQREFPEDTGSFPKRFTLELSNREDFGQRTIAFTSGTVQQISNDGYPILFNASDTARFVKLTVQEGHNKGTHDLFALSEFVVISKGGPVSFNAKVSTVGNLDVPGIWYPAALIDGRTHLGIWQNGVNPNPDRGDAVTVANASDPVSWTLNFDSAVPVDRVVLFPYLIKNSLETSVIPESLSLNMTADDGTETTVFEWACPLPGSSQTTPLVIPLGGQAAKCLRITASRAWSLGNLNIQALAEIEVWSHGKNLAKGLPVMRGHKGSTIPVSNLTDGFSSEKRIMPVGVWFHQLLDRGRIERELSMLKNVHRQLESRSELNATWGSSVVLGLTFLIPVFIVERRRLMSKQQLDQIRKRIASDLHDDIGSNLGSISLIARTARKDLTRLHGPEEIAEDLGEVESIACESSLAMRDIVWLLERQQDSIGDLVQRMRETANRLLREINFTIECRSNKTAAKLTLDSKRHLFLFYKEAIHNVLKHSQATRVAIRLWDEDDKLALEIKDNGIGISTSTRDRPPAVNKLEDRAHILGGLLQIASSKETGTRIRLLVKRSHLNSHPVLS